jgi:hypothetical protein
VRAQYIFVSPSWRACEKTRILPYISPQAALSYAALFGRFVAHQQSIACTACVALHLVRFRSLARCPTCSLTTHPSLPVENEAFEQKLAMMRTFTVIFSPLLFVAVPSCSLRDFCSFEVRAHADHFFF